MDFKHYKERSQIVRSRMPSVSGIPGQAWGHVAQQNVRVEKEGSTALNIVLDAINDTQEYIFYGGMLPYEIVQADNIYKHQNLAGNRDIHRLPIQNIDVITSLDGADSGKKIIEATEFGIVDVIFRDLNNYKKFAEIIVEPRVRSYNEPIIPGDPPIIIGGPVAATIEMVVGDRVKLNFFAGFSKTDITWINPSFLDLSIKPKQSIFSNNGGGPVVFIKALQESGPHTITVNGKQGTTFEFNINISAGPT